jgi:TonB family protein
MRRLLAFPILMAVVSVGHAQVGPSAARAISRPMPSKAPVGVQNYNAEAELLVDGRGRVDRVEILGGSGDESFDKQWRKSLSDWRFVPAVGADGEPAESNVRISYKNNNVTVLPVAPSGATPSAARTVLEESERLERLTCKDFLWEYEIVTDSLPRRLALLDPLLKTPQVMLAAEMRLTAEQQSTLRDRYDDVVNDAAKQCRDTPDAAVWSVVLKPLMQGAL